MYWFNEPRQWEVSQEAGLSMFVTPGTDYWRETHYGFTVDDGPFYYTQLGGEFEISVCISADYRSRYDQMGLMIRINEQNWIKTGVEFVDGKINLSAVVTRVKSDWSIISLDHYPEKVYLKAVRRLDAVEIFYSLDGKAYQMMRLAHFPDNVPVMAGMTAASPDGDGFRAHFEDFSITYLPDQRRQEWLAKNKS
jgi:regulation of enolase protein 1 (concanavalin A-like superfamily)